MSPGAQPSSSAPVDPFASAASVRSLVEQLPVAVYVDSDDRETVSLYISPNIERIVGYPPERFIEDRGLWDRVTHPEDRDRVLAASDEAWERGIPYRDEYRMVRPDGEEVWLRDSSILVRGENGERVAWQGVIEDITAEKRAEQVVRESAARYRALVERIPAVVYEMGPDDERRTLYVSPHVEEVLGYGRAEWLDQPDIWIELLHADDREIVLDRHDRHSRTGEPWDLEYRLIASDGRVVWVHDRGTLIRGLPGRPAAWHGVLIDVTAEHEAKEMLRITNEELERRVAERTAALEEANELMSLEIGERRRIEGELRETQERYRRLVENLPGIAYIWQVRPEDRGRSFTYVSPQVGEILGYAPEEWDSAARKHPHDRERVAEAVERSARTGEPFRIEFRYLAKDGHVVWVLDHASLIARNDRGEPHLFQGVMLDITGLKEAESKAAQAERRFRILAEQGPAISYSFELLYDGDAWPPGLKVHYVSPQAADLVGYPIQHWVARPENWFEMIHPDDRERVGEQTTLNWRTGSDWSLRYRIIRRDGAVIWLLDMGRMVERDGAGRPWRFQGVLLDVTGEQEAMLRLERLEADQRAVLDGAGVIPWTEEIDPETGFERYTYIGDQSLEILGYSPEELMVERKHFPRMVHPDDRSRMRGSLQLAAETGVWEEVYRILRRDGQIRWIRSFGRRVSEPGTSPEVWQGVAIDVTASHLHVASSAGAPEAERASPPA